MRPRLIANGESPTWSNASSSWKRWWRGSRTRFTERRSGRTRRSRRSTPERRRPSWRALSASTLGSAGSDPIPWSGRAGGRVARTRSRAWESMVSLELALRLEHRPKPNGRRKRLRRGRGEELRRDVLLQGHSQCRGGPPRWQPGGLGAIRSRGGWTLSPLPLRLGVVVDRELANGRLGGAGGRIHP
jgi:hypothetical protein